MKKYGKFASVGLFVFLGIFVLLQYQNCGNSSSSSSGSVGPSGLTYTVTLTPPSGTIQPNVQAPMTVRVQTSGSEQTYAVIGNLANGVKNPLCRVYSPGPSTDYTVSSCAPPFTGNGSEVGTVNLYVDIFDSTGAYPQNEYMIDCSILNGSLPAGCQGIYTVNVQ